jgi:hypothetical protein
MTSKFLKHKWQKLLATVLLVFLLLITVVAYFVNRHWSPILAERVRNAVLESSDSLYHANFTDAELHIVQSKLVIHNLTLTPNEAVYKRLLKMGVAPNNLYTIKVKRLVFKNIHPLKLYYHRQLDIGQIILSAPELQVSYTLNRKRDSTTNGPNAWQRIKGMLKWVHVKEVLLNDVKFTYKDYSGNELNISELKEMNLTGKELLIDSTTQKDSSRFYYFKDLQVELNNFSRPSDNGLYQYRIKQLQYSTLTSQLQAFGVGLIPAPDSVFINRKVRSWFHFDTDTLKLNGFDFKTYNKYRILHASHLLLKRGNLVIFANPAALAPRKGNRLLTFPNVAIHQLKNDFTLDTVNLNHLNITYKGYGKRSHKQGMVSYNNTNGYIYNITNNTAALLKNNILRMQLSSYLMDSGLLQADLTFNLTDSARSYAYKGSVGPMDLGKLNKATMPFALVKITSGDLDQLVFDIKADQNVSSGNVTMLYHDLKIHVLKMDTVDNLYRHRGMASLFANALIVKRNNPDKPGGMPRSFNVTYMREPNTAFFKTVWETLSKGINASAGYNEAMQKEVKRHIAQRKADKIASSAKKVLRDRRRAKRKRR